LRVIGGGDGEVDSDREWRGEWGERGEVGAYDRPYGGVALRFSDSAEIADGGP
jgi:hypothetical protein